MYVWFPDPDPIDVAVDNSFDTSDSPPPPSQLLERLIATKKEIQDLKKKSDILTTHCFMADNAIKQCQTKLNTKQQWKGVHMKRTMAAARVLTYEDGSVLLEIHHEEEWLKEVKRVEDRAQKDAKDEAHCKQ